MNSSPPLLVLRGHQGAIYDVTWVHPWGTWCTAGGDGVVAKWHPGQSNGTAVLQHAKAFYSLCSWRGGVAAGNADGQIWLMGDGEPVVLQGHQAPIFSLQVDSKGRLWSGDGQGIVKVWNGHQATPTCLAEHNTDMGKIRHLGEFGSGQVVVAGGSGAWAVFSIDGPQGSHALQHEGSCYWACKLPNKEAVVSGGHDGCLAIHKQGHTILQVPAHQSAIYRGVLSGNVLWTASRDKDVKAWDTNTMEFLYKLPRPHARSVNALAMGGPSNEWLATAGDDRVLKVWHR